MHPARVVYSGPTNPAGPNLGRASAFLDRDGGNGRSVRPFPGVIVRTVHPQAAVPVMLAEPSRECCSAKPGISHDYLELVVEPQRSVIYQQGQPSPAKT